MSTPMRIGLIGLGNMGAGMARNIREDIQSVFFSFILFDPVQYSAPAVNR